MERLTFAVKESKVEGRTLSGVAHAYGTVTVDGRKHSFAPGFFAKSIAAGKMAAYWGHSPSMLRLGSQKAGTLQLADGQAVTFSLKLPKTHFADDLIGLVEAGEEVGVSFEVYASKSEKRGDVRVFTEGEVTQINVVAEPAFEGTSVILNSAEAGEPAYSSTIKIRAHRLTQTVIGLLADERRRASARPSA